MSHDITEPFPVTVVWISAWKSDNTPVPMMESAVCDTCGAWARQMWTAGRITDAGEDMFDRRISRSTQTIVYACDDHYEAVGSALCDEFGGAVNQYEPNELAMAVGDRK